MTALTTEAALSAIREFAIDGEVVELEAYERGHIHNTFIATWRNGDDGKRYLHQQLNDRVFTDIPGLMHNIASVTRHLHCDTAREGELRSLRLVPTRRGAAFHRDGTGPWRTYEYIEDTESYDLCESEQQAFEAARAFGHFQARLIDLDVGALHQTIPDFFSSPHRLRQLEAALAQDRVGRRAEAAAEIAFVEARRGMIPVIDDCLRQGRFPPRVVHGDTKLNNVLFDRWSRRAVCIVDLDTCMSAYSLYDFGDLVRFTAATSSEDETDLDKVGMDLGLYRALVDGYMWSAKGFLTDAEVELMPFAARLVTLTIGIRFLTDFLAGDVYFKVAHPGHNLDRARVQFKMVESMERQERQMTVR